MVATFPRRLAAIGVAALVARVAFTLVAGYDAEGQLGDPLHYHLLGRGLAEGLGYIRAFDWTISGVRVPTAEFPPLFPLLLAALHLVGIDTVRGQELTLGLVGASTVVVIGLVGRRLAGEVVGLVAAGLAAAYPMLLLPDATLQPEGLYGLLIAITLLLALRADGSRALVRWAGIGAVVGLAALTRSEALLLLPLVVVPAARAWQPLLVATGCAIAVLSPWVGRNLVALDAFVPLSNNSSTLLAGANCDDAWYGEAAGTWVYACTEAVPIDGRDEIERSTRFRRAGLDHLGDNLGGLPRVAAIRVLRTFGLWSPASELRIEEGEGRSPVGLRAGYAAYLLIAAAALGGAVGARRRRLTIGPLLGTIGLVVVASAIGYGNQRFRMAAEPALVVLAAVGLVTLTGRLRQDRA